ncbi:MAG: tRNA1(Val) (adenine(37)-N6)-methyltransferase [Methyloceanibacter sp.]
MSSPTTRKARPSEKPGGALSVDDFLGGRISVEQRRKGYRAGSDAVFLAAAVPALAKQRVLDAGAGVGAAGLCLLARSPAAQVTAVEIDAETCALAESNAARNGFADRFEAIHTDVTALAKVLRAAGLPPESFDHVIANPPFHAEGEVREASEPVRAAAHVMARGGFAAWLRFLAAMTAPKGWLTLIHRPECLPELLTLLEGRFGDLAVFPLFPKANKPASRIIVQGRKGNRAPIRLLTGLVLHQADGTYTPAAEAVLREGEALDLGRVKK